jgi:hypothetical protein
MSASTDLHLVFFLQNLACHFPSMCDYPVSKNIYLSFFSNIEFINFQGYWNILELSFILKILIFHYHSLLEVWFK